MRVESKLYKVDGIYYEQHTLKYKCPEQIENIARVFGLKIYRKYGYTIIEGECSKMKAFALKVSSM